jgi:hypothetical protein
LTTFSVLQKLTPIASSVFFLTFESDLSGSRHREYLGPGSEKGYLPMIFAIMIIAVNKIFAV